MAKVYVGTTFSKNESPLSSRKLGAWDRKLMNGVAMQAIAMRETRGSYGVIEDAVSWAFDRFFIYDISKAVSLRWINRTGSAKHEEITPSIPYPNDNFASGDKIYMGYSFPFDGANYETSTAGIGGTTTYEYWNNEISTWVSFSPTSGATINNFTIAAGTPRNITWDLSSLKSWGATTLNAIISPSGYTIDNTSLFWIRINIGAYGTYPVFDYFLTDGDTIDLKVLPIYTGYGASRAVWITPGKVIIDGTIWDLDTLSRLEVSLSQEVYPYYVAVVVDSRGFLSIVSQITGYTPVQVISYPESVKLADILVTGTSAIETLHITDTRVLFG